MGFYPWKPAFSVYCHIDSMIQSSGPDRIYCSRKLDRLDGEDYLTRLGEYCSNQARQALGYARLLDRIIIPFCFYFSYHIILLSIKAFLS